MAVTADFKKLLEQKRSVYQVWDIMEDDVRSNGTVLLLLKLTRPYN